MIFADASALVAILAEEPDAGSLAEELARHAGEVWVSPLVRFEVVASMAVARARRAGRPAASPDDFAFVAGGLDELLVEVGAQEVAITPEIGRAALDAAARFGKLAGHPARLNMGDCFAYACTRSLGAALLYKGEDFAETDLA